MISSRYHGFLWLSLAVYLYSPLKLEGPLDYILCPTESSCRSSWSFIWRVPRENIAYELILTSLAISSMSCSSDLNGFRDGRSVAIQLLFCGMLLSGFVYSSQRSQLPGFIQTRLKIKQAYFEATVQHFIHFAPCSFSNKHACKKNVWTTLFLLDMG